MAHCDKFKSSPVISWSDKAEKAEEKPRIVVAADARSLAATSEPDEEEVWHRNNIRRFVEKANAEILNSAKTGSRFTSFYFDGCVEKGDMEGWSVNEYIHQWFTPEILDLLRKAGYADASVLDDTVIIRW